MTDDEIKRANDLRNRDMNYELIAKKIGRYSADDVRDVLIPGWRENPVARGRHKPR